MKTSQEINKVLPKLAKAMNDLGAVKKSADNPFFRSKYADLNSHIEVAENALGKQGLILLQPVDRDERGSFVESIIMDPESSQFVSSRMDLVLAKADMQQMGSAVTYARRYTLGALLSMQSEDDDANLASGKVTKASGTVTSIPQTTTKRSPFRKNTGPNAAVSAAPAEDTSTTETVEGWE